MQLMLEPAKATNATAPTRRKVKLFVFMVYYKRPVWGMKQPAFNLFHPDSITRAIAAVVATTVIVPATAVAVVGIVVRDRIPEQPGGGDASPYRQCGWTDWTGRP